MSASEAAAVLIRWRAHGGSCRVVGRGPSGVVVELVSCDGEPMERLVVDPADVAALDEVGD